MKDYACPECGWWDMTMKYSPTIFCCTQCNAILINKIKRVIDTEKQKNKS
jgi:endogenous inhibitor of DNA gyrase (YacG/DUF329 family)